MAYCSNAELVLETGSSLSTSILDSIIAAADRKIKTRILVAGLTPPTSNDTLKTASIELSKAGLVRWNQLNGSQTKSVKVGDITIQDDPEAAIAALTGAAYQDVDGYIAINSGCPIPTLAIVGRSGQRIGAHEEMTDAEEAA